MLRQCDRAVGLVDALEPQLRIVTEGGEWAAIYGRGCLVGVAHVVLRLVVWARGVEFQGPHRIVHRLHEPLELRLALFQGPLHALLLRNILDGEHHAHHPACVVKERRPVDPQDVGRIIGGTHDILAIEHGGFLLNDALMDQCTTIQRGAAQRGYRPAGGNVAAPMYGRRPLPQHGSGSAISVHHAPRGIYHGNRRRARCHNTVKQVAFFL